MRERGEGWGEGRLHALKFVFAAAPHPDLLPVKDGEKGKFSHERSFTISQFCPVAASTLTLTQR
jgi:hypothetical protein